MSGRRWHPMDDRSGNLLVPDTRPCKCHACRRFDRYTRPSSEQWHHVFAEVSPSLGSGLRTDSHEQSLLGCRLLAIQEGVTKHMYS